MKRLVSSAVRQAENAPELRRVPTLWLWMAFTMLVCASPQEKAAAQVPFIGQIQMFAGTFAPNGWLFCEGQLLPIAEHEALFALIGTTYGGDGQQTFALPDLRGRVIVSAGQGSGLSNYVVGQTGGVESVTLTQSQLPSHAHTLFADSLSGTSDTPAGLVPAEGPDGIRSYGMNAINPMSPNALSNVGGGQAHNNLKPYLAIRYIIAVQGIFPARN